MRTSFWTTYYKNRILEVIRVFNKFSLARSRRLYVGRTIGGRKLIGRIKSILCLEKGFYLIEGYSRGQTCDLMFIAKIIRVHQVQLNEILRLCTLFDSSQQFRFCHRRSHFTGPLVTDPVGVQYGIPNLLAQVHRNETHVYWVRVENPVLSGPLVNFAIKKSAQTFQYSIVGSALTEAFSQVSIKQYLHPRIETYFS